MNAILFYLSILIVSFFPFKKIAKYMAVIIPSISSFLSLSFEDFRGNLLGRFGVSLILDDGSRYFLLLTSIVYTGVAIYRFKERWSYIDQFLFLSSFATLSLTFMSVDLFNLYVMMEVLSIQAGLMVLKNLDEGTLWATLKYLILSVIGANIYLIGVGMIYSENSTFDVFSISKVGDMAFFLILVGLMIRVGIFGFGMWPPMFYSKASFHLSALFSSVFVKSGVYTFYRLSENPIFFEKIEKVDFLIPMFVLGSAILSLGKSKFKEVVATSSMAHMGLMVFSSESVPLYAFVHGISKAPLFLGASERKMSYSDTLFYIAFLISMMGAPLSAGGNVEKMILRSLDPTSRIIVMISSAILGYSLLSRLNVKLEGMKPSIHNIVFFSIFVIMSFETFKGVELVSVFVPVVAISCALLFKKRVLFKEMEYLERLDVNVSVVIFALMIIGWMVIT